MGSKKPDNTLALWGEAEATQATVATWSTLGPRRFTRGRPIQSREIDGQREYSGGPPVVRDTQNYDQVREEALAESEECQDLEKKV